MLGKIEELNYKQEALIKVLQKQFPLTNNQNQFNDFYPFCNELGFAQIIKNLKQISAYKTNKIKVALLFGESNFISLLPHLEQIADIVLLADIQPSLHKHTAFLLQCFNKANNPEEFISFYEKVNPIENYPRPTDNGMRYDSNLLQEMLCGSKSLTKSLGNYYFLHNKESFERCKKALTKFKILQINLDLIDDNACNKLASQLNASDALLTLCNFTNIHHYVEPDKLSTATHLLLKDNLDECLIMFSTGPLRTLRAFCTVGLTNYLTIPKNKSFCEVRGMALLRQSFDTQKNSFATLFNRNSLFLQKTKNTSKIPQLCYVGYHLEHSRLKEFDIQKIIDGKDNPLPYSTEMHAFDTEKEAEDFIRERFFKSSDVPQPENTYWIFIVRGNKDKINPLLRCLDNYNQWLHYPIDNMEAGVKFCSKIIKAINNTRTIVIENDEVEKKQTCSSMTI